MNRFIIGVAAALFAAASARAECLVKTGEKIAFLGDSITEFGNWPAGYVNMVITALEVEGVKAVKIPAGVSGNKSNQMLARLPKILEKKPEWLTFSCGVNDVWHGKNGVPLDKYVENVTQILDLCAKNGTKVVILTPTMIHEDPAGKLNVQLEPYLAWLREEARKRGLLLADLNRRMHETLAKLPPAKGNRLTRDGVHMAWAGDVMMATGVLEAFGVDAAKNPKIAEAWENLPDAVRRTLHLSQADVELIDSQKTGSETRKQCAERLMKAGKSIRATVPEAKKTEPTKGPMKIAFLGGREFSYGGTLKGMVARGFRRAGYDYSSVAQEVNSRPTEELLAKADVILAAKPDRAVFLAGTYEMRAQMPNETYAMAYTALQATVSSIFAKFDEAKIPLVVCGLPPLAAKTNSFDNLRAARYNAWLKEECAKRKYAWIDSTALVRARTAELKSLAGYEKQGEDYAMRGYYHMILNWHGCAALAKGLMDAFGIPVDDALVAQWKAIPQTFLLETGFSRTDWKMIDRRSERLDATSDRDPVSYRCGETAVVTFDPIGAPAGTEVDWEAEGDYGYRLAGKGNVVKVTLDRPGFVWIRAKYGNGQWPRYYNASVGFDIEKITPDSEKPADFDAFWERQKALVKATPMNPEVEEVKSPTLGVKLYKVHLAVAGAGKLASGWLSVPRGAEKYPAEARFFGYGNSWAAYHHVAPEECPTDRIQFLVNAHPYRLEADTAHYEAVRAAAESNGYTHGLDPAQNAKPETAYFYGMVLRDLTAMEYLKTRPEWNGKDLLVYGPSQGGLQAIWMAALADGVTKAEPEVPWNCNMAGYVKGRIKPSRLPIPDAAGLAYFDPCHMATRFPATLRIDVVRAGLGDYCCPPSGVAAFYNRISCPKSITWVQGSEHGGNPTDVRSYQRKSGR